VKRLEKLLRLPERERSKPARELRYRRHLTEQEQSHIVASYFAGQTVYQLGHQFGVHRDRISRILEAANVDRRYHQSVDVDLDRAAALQAQGFTLQQIADQFGIGRTALVVARRKARLGGLV
jgi:transcriptional regulator with XRE-family HTH domain